MGKSKEKGTKKSKGSELSAKPTFEFDLDFEDNGASRTILDENDQKSVTSSASKKVMKKVENLLSENTQNSKKTDLDGRSSHSQFKKKKGSSHPTNSDFVDAGPDDSGKTKKKKKKGSKSALGGKKVGSVSSGFDDDASVRKKKSRRKKKKKSDDEDDDDVYSVQSSRSTRSKRSVKKSRSKGDLLGMDIDTSYKDQRRQSDMAIENAALLEETATIRRQLNETEKALKKALSEQNSQQGNFDQIRELERAQNESRELKRELEEYEDAVIEKDELIQKLTEAVDAQLDKVEILEVKLERAEEEFCKMEEEMKEMEDVIDDLRSGTSSQAILHNEQNGNSPDDAGKLLDEEILEQLEKREREIDKREQELLEKEDYILDRETLVKQQDEELKMKRSSLLKPQRSFDSGRRDKADDVEELESKIIQLEAENNDLAEEIEILRQHDSGKTVRDDTLVQQHEEELRSLRDGFDKRMEDVNLENEMLRQEIDGLKQVANSKVEELKQVHDSSDGNMPDLNQAKNSDDKELEFLREELDGLKQREKSKDEENKSLRENFDKQLADSKLENEILRQELDGFKQRKNAENEALRQQIEEIKKQKTHVEASSRQLRRMDSMRMESMRMLVDPESTAELEIDQDEEFGLEVEVEIAELREKIVEQEQHSMKLKKEIGAHVSDNEDLKQELEERELELKELENQLSTMKESSSKKMKQKDETITFMQQTMMQINQEKQELDRKLRDSNLGHTQIKLMNRKEDDEAEKEKLEAINIQLRKLDDENRVLEEELNRFKYNSSLQLKEKESAILQLQEELSDVKWELGAREKGADYITLLKDRKERKNQLAKARKDLKEAEEKIVELEEQNKDLEKEVESLTNSPENVGEQISGLKRQVKSLKQHNTTLERKIDTESRDFKDTLNEKEAKICILEFELHKLRNVTPQTAIRGAVSGFITGFGRRNDEGNVDNARNESNIKGEEGSATKTAENTGGNRWNFFGQRKEAQRTADNDKITSGNQAVGNGVNGREGFEDNETL